MSLLSLLQQSQNGQGLGALADQFGLDADKASDLTALLAPALGSAAKKQAASGNLTALLGALKGEDQGALFDDATAAASEAGQLQGKAFLDNLLGGSDGADELTNQAAASVGVDTSIVQQFLPALAAMAQGGLQKNLPDASIDTMTGGTPAGGLVSLASKFLGGDSQGPDLSILTNLLDADDDGSVLDDIMGKFLK